MKSWTMFIVSLLAIAGVAAPSLAAQPMIGTEAPVFSLPTLAGGVVSLSDYRGKAVVLHFGAGW